MNAVSTLAATGYARAARRYALPAGGPLCVSAAHFLAALLVLHVLPPAEFGIFAFVLIVVPLCLSASGALLVAPLANAAVNPKADSATYLKANLAYSCGAALLCAALAGISGASLSIAALFGLYGGAMCLRWFARAVAYAADRPGRVAASDLCYGLSLTGTLVILWSLGSLSLAHVAVALTASVTAATACFGTPYLRRQFALSEGPPLRTYAASWRELTRWSLLGVVLTEATANAHAYLVTFVSGPQSFALLAIGALFLRPVSLCLSALPDVERPSMARSLAGGDRAAAERCVREFRAVGCAIWMGTCLLSAAVLIWLPSMALKQNYRLGDVVLVVALWAAIMAVRLLRTPDSVLLQAAGEFRVLARTTYLSSAVSIAATLALLLALGPVASLFGILAGDSVMTAQILAAARRWRRARD